jgi:hypothetical protein
MERSGSGGVAISRQPLPRFDFRDRGRYALIQTDEQKDQTYFLYRSAETAQR